MARVSSDVYATSNAYPPSFSNCPAAFASERPVSDRSTSVQPVKRFSLFHVLSPCRSNTSLCIGESAEWKVHGLMGPWVHREKHYPWTYEPMDLWTYFSPLIAPFPA